MPATHDQFMAKLKKVAPSIAVKTTWTPDNYFSWDGDGPDPTEEGYQAYDVDVWAKAIVDGEIVEGQGSIGGSYSKPGEHDPDVHGYFLDLLQKALADLYEQTQSGELDRQINEAKDLIERAARIRYDERHNPTKKQDWSPRRRKQKRL